MHPQPQVETATRPRCPHCGTLLKLKTGRCWVCQKNPEEWAAESQESEVTVEGTVITMPESKPQVDTETGEVYKQATLDPTIFPATERRQVPMVKIGFSGSVEMTRSEWESYCDQGLEPGRVVKLSLTGYMPDPHAKWVKRTETETDPVTKRKETSTWYEREGRIGVRVVEIGRFEVTGREWSE